jgi:hypothetical protein
MNPLPSQSYALARSEVGENFNNITNKILEALLNSASTNTSLIEPEFKKVRVKNKSTLSPEIKQKIGVIKARLDKRHKKGVSRIDEETIKGYCQELKLDVNTVKVAKEDFPTGTTCRLMI